MTQEDKELLLKDICARLPYEIKVSVDNKHWCDFHKDIPVKLTLENTYRILLGVSLGYVKPYLFPLSSMTEEQKLEIKSLCDGTEIFDDGGWMSYISILGSFNFEINLAVVDWYNKNHFDYRGLIPMGLANDATGLNIY